MTAMVVRPTNGTSLHGGDSATANPREASPLQILARRSIRQHCSGYVASVRLVHGPSGPYKVLVQSYRWEGQVRQKQFYLGASIPRNLEPLVDDLHQRIWNETWFPLFDRIRAAYRERSGRIPAEVIEAEREDFLIRFTFSTNRIEGSSLTLEETRSIVENSAVPKAKAPV